jgi:hypothetical protein
MWRNRLGLAILGGLLSGPAAAQITVPYTFTAGTVISADQVNANFAALASQALNRASAPTLTTSVLFSPDAAVDLGTSLARPRDLVLARDAVVGGNVTVGGALTIAGTATLGAFTVLKVPVLSSQACLVAADEGSLVLVPGVGTAPGIVYICLWTGTQVKWHQVQAIP